MDSESLKSKSAGPRSGSVRGRSQAVIRAAQSRLEKVRISPSKTIADAIRQLDEAGTGALILCERSDEFYGLITDGDIRRGFLRGVRFEDLCGRIATKKPFTATIHQRPAEMLEIMNKLDINHLPLVDEKGCTLGLILRQDLTINHSLEMSAVIMAGGRGSRLMPLTQDVPKPMLPVGDRPLMERTIEHLRKAGIRRVNVTTHHLSERITEHFRDGSDFGVELQYTTEEHPLGTAGCLGFLGQRKEPTLVLNGDILTSVNYRDLLAYHREVHADLTVGVRHYDVQIPYGVIDCDGAQVTGLREKPTMRFLVNAGIYILEPIVSYFIPLDRKFDMTDLIASLLEAGRKVASFPIREYWLDIGQRHDYDQANEDIRLGKVI